MGYVVSVGQPGGIRDHYGTGSQGLFESAFPPLGASFRLKVLSVSVFSSRALTLLGVLRVIPVLAPLHPSERSRLVPEPSFFFLPFRGLFSSIFFYRIPLIWSPATPRPLSRLISPGSLGSSFEVIRNVFRHLRL